MKKLWLLAIMILSCGIAHAASLRGNISPSGEMTVSGGYWECIYEDTLESALTTLTISGLNGDVDEVYRLDAKIVNGYDGASLYSVRPNNDTGSNYGYQKVEGENSIAAASRDTATGIYVGYINGFAKLNQSSLTINAKSGYVRTGIKEMASTISTNTVTNMALYGWSWNNTTDNITSLMIFSDQANGIGIGSHIRLWRWKHD